MNKKLEEIWRSYDVSYKNLLDLLPEALRGRCKRISYAPEETIVSEGDTIEYLYFIESGVVDGMKRYENGKDYQYFKLDKANGAIGLLEIFSRQRRIIATIVAKTPVTVLRADAAELYAYIMEDMTLLRKYTYHIAMDLYRDSGKNGQLFYQSGLERVSSYLTDYYMNNSYRQDRVIVRQSYQAIANQIGVSTRTVGRAVRCLQENGLCAHEGKSICIDRRQYEGLKGREEAETDGMA